jgi:hypothetical protein
LQHALLKARSTPSSRSSSNRNSRVETFEVEDDD